jgi:methylase of polypeptide subunit release factors
MKDIIKEQLTNYKSHSVDDRFAHLLRILGFSDKISKDEDFDFVFNFKHDEIENTIIGIKKMYNEDINILKQFHKKMWNKNNIPITVFVLPNDIIIYNNYTINETKKILNSLKKDGLLAFDEITLENISSNEFWAKFNKIINKSDRVDRKLLLNLKHTIIKLHKDEHMPISKAHNFLSKFIFIKYLEDRGILTSTTYKNFNAEGLINILSSTELLKFFQYMHNKFGGEIFDIKNKIELPTKKQLQLIKSFFKGEEITTGQQRFFPYDFSIIPIELISNIYETFLTIEEDFNKTSRGIKKDSGSFYTPYFLADLMLNNAIGKIANNQFSVLDPACGSGVFLVLAFKKLVNYHQGLTQKINPNELKDLLLKNIYGVDVNPNTLKITQFSLYIALLDCIEPKDIEKNKFQLPKLNGNLFASDFFNKKIDKKIPKVDLIIGNPPWKSTNKNIGSLHIAYTEKENLCITDNQICQSFLYRAKDFMGEASICALLVTNSVFYNTLASKFRKHFFRKFQLSEITNFQKLKNEIFIDAKAPCSSIMYSLRKNNNDYHFYYYNVEKQLISDIFNCLLIDKSDYFKIDFRLIEKYDYIWRVIHSGSELDFELIKKLKNLSSSIDQFITSNNLKISQGVAVAQQSKLLEGAEELLGANLISNFNKFFIDYDKLTPFKNSMFERIHDPEAYFSSNKVIIKRSITNKSCSAAYIQKSIIFSNDFFCIFSKANENQHLLFLTGLFNSKLYNYYQYHMAPSYTKGSQPEVRQVDIKEFPIPDINFKIIKKISENVLELQNLWREYIFQKRSNVLSMIDTEKYNRIEIISSKITALTNLNDSLIYELYKITENDITIIDHTEKYILGKDKSTNVDIKHYINKLKKHFTDLFDDEYRIDIKTKSKFFYTIVLIKFISKNNVSEKNKEEEDFLQHILNFYNIFSLEELNNKVLIKRDLMGFFNDGFFIVKINDSEFWDDYSAIKDINKFTNIMFEGYYDENNK